MGSPSFTAMLLRASADGFAGLAASRLLSDDDPQSESQFGEWKAHLRSQVLELAAAVEVEEPQRYAQRVAWSRDAFAARDVESDVPRAAIQALAGVLQDSLPDEAWLLLPDYFQLAEGELDKAPVATPSELVGDSEAVQLARSYVESILNGDEAKAVRAVLEVVQQEEMSPEDVLELVVAPAQREIGRLWHMGKIGVADEHFATMVTRKLLVRLTPVEQVYDDRTVVVSAVAGDAHDIGVQLVAAFFQLAGWRAICLGADVPSEDLLAIVDRFDADVVALGATLENQRAAVTTAIAILRAKRPDQVVIVGGSAFAGAGEPWRHVGADGEAGSPREAVALAARLAAK